MRDYITTVFNLIVGLVNPNKLVLLALVGIGIIIVWQLLSLLTSFNSRLAKKCRRISKFLTTKGLSSENYNKFISLVAKMPQEFIRGYKTFEHASFGLPSDYIKRFDSIDVEVNGGIFNHGKSLLKSFIYGFGAILALLSLALMGEEASVTGYGLADALLIPLLFIIVSKVIYYIFVAIKQQQYKVAVDEFNEMLDIMNDKIENNDSLPGPDVLAELEPIASGSVTTSPILNKESLETTTSQNLTQADNNMIATSVEDANSWEDELTDNKNVLSQDTYVAEPIENNFNQEPATSNQIEEQENTADDNQLLNEATDELLNNKVSQSQEDVEMAVEEQDEYTESDLSNLDLSEEIDETEEPEDTSKDQTAVSEEIEQNSLPKVYLPETNSVSSQNVITDIKPVKEKTVEEQKRGRGRPKKVTEGELVITNDKQFEEVLERAEKLMRKSEEALSASQAKRVEKALKELVDAMTKYKEEK